MNTRELPSTSLDSIAIGAQNVVFHGNAKGGTVGDKLDSISLSVQVAINIDGGNSKTVKGILLGRVVLDEGGQA